VHGLDGPVAIVSGYVADFIVTNTNLRQVRTNHQGADFEIDAGLAALLRVALDHRTSADRGRNSPSGGRSLDLAPEVPAPSQVMSTGEAAEALGITSRAVRFAIAENRLPATQIDGCWQITRTDLANYRGRRPV
jgi:excisionase family DNA binding protein